MSTFASAVPCPVCHVPAGDPCQTVDGTARVEHRARTRLRLTGSSTPVANRPDPDRSPKPNRPEQTL